MCGICGQLNLRPAGPPPAEDLTRRMCTAITHRGPDDEGYYTDERVSLGMRRLSIIDLDTGRQPIFNEDRSVVVVFNGEIFNYRELRSDLEARGHRFATQSDTEVIVHLYEEYGVDFPTHLNGMFAIALWDTQEERLLLVRDRLGQKPLYYAQGARRIVFGSEIKCVLLDEDISTQVDEQAIYNYMVLGYIPQPRTVYRGIRKLPPGTMLIADNTGVTTRRYWEYPAGERFSGSYESACEQLRQLLTNAAQIRMISDVSLGAFLSGGLDSSITVALMAQLSDTPVETFFIDFEEAGYSERDYARAVAKRYQTNHHEFVVRPDATAVLEEIVKHCDEPFGDSSAVPTYYLSQMTRRHVTVALAGDGGDESFGGYNRYAAILQRKERTALRPIFSKLGPAVHRLLPRLAPGRRYFRSLGFSNYEMFTVGAAELEARDLFSPAFLERVENSVLADLEGEPRGVQNGSTDPLTQYARFDINWYLPDDILTKVDRMSMAHSLEVRSPFLDYRVVEFAAGLPVEWKIQGDNRKRILKDTFRRDLPSEILEPRKRGFSLPLGEWFRSSLKDQLLAALHDADMEDSGLFNMHELRGLAAEHLAGRRCRKSQLWRFLVFSKWWKTQQQTTPCPEVTVQG